jgi:hypothetical protein
LATSISGLAKIGSDEQFQSPVHQVSASAKMFIFDNLNFWAQPMQKLGVTDILIPLVHIHSESAIIWARGFSAPAQFVFPALP